MKQTYELIAPCHFGLEAVLKREKEYSAALGYEVAIPHEQSDTVKDPFVVFGRVKEPIL